MKKNFFKLTLPVAALVLELLPWGAVLNFGRLESDGTIGTLRETCSYFSLTPFGYANFGPLLTAVLTCCLITVLAFFCFTQRTFFLITAIVLSGIAVLTSIMPLILGISYISVVGTAITIVLVLNFYLLIHRL